MRPARIAAVGVSGLLDFVSDVVQRGGLQKIGQHVRLDWDVEKQVELDLFGGPPPVTANIHDRSKWPRHWQRAEGLSDSHRQLQGATHTVDEFDMAREQGPMHATLVGTWKVRVGSGDRAVGHFRDRTGSVQAQLSGADSLNASSGPGGLCEVDVVGVPSAGLSTSAMPDACDWLAVLLEGSDDARRDLAMKMFANMASLDISVTILAMRPIE